jgi:hypothetical protein
MAWTEDFCLPADPRGGSSGVDIVMFDGRLENLFNATNIVLHTGANS